MKAKIINLLVLFIISLFANSQTDSNPFKKLGYDVLVATSSKGKYEEFHDQKEIVEMGSVLFNTKTKKIVRVLDIDESTLLLSASISAMSIDPLCEKYYWISPYAYVANNPIKFIDPDGRKIIPVNVNHRNGQGRARGEAGLSRKTNAAMTDIMKTSEGRAFFGQFAEKGQTLGGHTFTENGKYSSTDLTIYDYSWDKVNGQILPSSTEGILKVAEGDDGKMKATLTINSHGMDKNDIGEVVTHETQIHGYKAGDKIDGKTVPNQHVDHKALKNKDTKHKGYNNYNSVRKQLEAIDEKYKKSFQNAEQHANDQY